MSRRVVITGLGALTPVGNDVETTWANLIAGKSGIAPITSFDATGYDVRFAGEVKGFDPTPCFRNPKDTRRADRFTHMALAASRQAVAHAGLDNNTLDLDRVGVIIGSGIGGLKSISDQHTILITKGPGRISPFMIPMMIANMASGIVSMELGYRGPNFAIVTACATGSQSIGEAGRLIRDDEADVILAGGSEAAATELGMAGFAAMKALSPRNDAPEKASRPFDVDRDGFVLGEGAGVIVLEEYEHAKKRGATILAELTGYGLTADAYHMSSPAPEGAGAAKAMERALKQARRNPADISYVNMHGTSTPLGDVCETQAIKKVFGESAKTVSCSSTKSMIGHLLGAAGSVESIICIKALETGIIPPTINLDNQDPQCDLDYTPHTAKQKEIKVVVNNSFGFGGHNSSLIFEKVS
jgi:3-oxoacyl-[acyl-carrier-protein] synthase II